MVDLPVGPRTPGGPPYPLFVADGDPDWPSGPLAQPTAWAAARPATRPENRQPPRKVPSSAL
jgi:hypothetical protein